MLSGQSSSSCFEPHPSVDGSLSASHVRLMIAEKCHLRHLKAQRHLLDPLGAAAECAGCEVELKLPGGGVWEVVKTHWLGWVWLKIQDSGLRRLLSIFPFTRVPFWATIFDPQPGLYDIVGCCMPPASVHLLAKRGMFKTQLQTIPSPVFPVRFSGQLFRIVLSFSVHHGQARFLTGHSSLAEFTHFAKRWHIVELLDGFSGCLSTFVASDFLASGVFRAHFEVGIGGGSGGVGLCQLCMCPG